MILGIIITILIIIGVIVETIIIGRILTDLRVIDNMQECDKEFWEDEDGIMDKKSRQVIFNKSE